MRIFSKELLEKVCAVAVAVVLTVAMIPAGEYTAFAETVQSYNVSKVVAYAKEHYDDFKTASSDGGNCIQFVRECFEAGGVPTDIARTYGYTVRTYTDYAIDNGYAQMYELTTEEQPWATPQWYVRASDNAGKLAVGDGILYYCNGCNTFFHAAICTSVDEDGFAHYYAQNIAVADKPICKIDHKACGTNRQDVTLYALHITSSANGYSSSYDNAVITNLKVLRTGNNTLNIIWDPIEGATGYKVFVKNGADSVLNKINETAGTSITYTEPTAGANYYFAVRPYFVKDGKEYVGKLSVVVKNDQEQNSSKLAAPKINVTTVSPSYKIKIGWNRVPGANSYEVYRAKSKSGTYTKIYSGTGTSCTNSSVSLGTKYYYKVKAIDADTPAFNSGYSSVVSKTCVLATPNVKTSTVSSSGKITLSWGKVSSASKYEVYRSTKSSSGFKKLATTTKTSYTNTSASAGTKYYYRVRAVYSKNSGANSSYCTVSQTCKLARPSTKVSVNSSSGKPKVYWNKVSSASKYYVYRATSKGGTYSKIATTYKTSYTNSSATAGKKYYYKVVAVHKKSAANSAYSSVVSETCDLAKPKVSVSNSSKGKLKLTWKTVSGAEKYTVYRATSKNGKYSKLTTTTKTSYTNSFLKNGKTYYYKVKAIDSNSSANSAYSTVVYKTCK